MRSDINPLTQMCVHFLQIISSYFSSLVFAELTFERYIVPGKRRDIVSFLIIKKRKTKYDLRYTWTLPPLCTLFIRKELDDGTVR